MAVFGLPVRQVSDFLGDQTTQGRKAQSPKSPIIVTCMWNLTGEILQPPTTWLSTADMMPGTSFVCWIWIALASFFSFKFKIWCLVHYMVVAIVSAYRNEYSWVGRLWVCTYILDSIHAAHFENIWHENYPLHIRGYFSHNAEWVVLGWGWGGGGGARDRLWEVLYPRGHYKMQEIRYELKEDCLPWHILSDENFSALYCCGSGSEPCRSSEVEGWFKMVFYHLLLSEV